MQTRLLKILLLSLSLVFGSLSMVHGQVMLSTADSLFRAKQYTQSFELYHQLFKSHRYSHAMLLKMAYIQEGLGHISKSIYYLQLYYQASHDEYALKKITELADKNRLEGYAADNQPLFRTTWHRYSSSISVALFAMVVLFLAMLLYQKRKYQQKPLWPAFGILVFITLLFVQVNFSQNINQGIVNQVSTYLMSGPSAGSSVAAIIGEGHQLKITGKKDVWLRVQWMDKEVFVKEDKVMRAVL